MNTYNNLTKVLKPFENKWVALTRDYKKVIDYGDTLNEVTSKIKKNEKGNPHSIYKCNLWIKIFDV